LLDFFHIFVRTFFGQKLAKIGLKNSMRQDVDQVHLLSPFSCPCAGGDVQGVYSEKIVLDVLEGPFSTIAIGGRVFDKGGMLSL